MHRVHEKGNNLRDIFIQGNVIWEFDERAPWKLKAVSGLLKLAKSDGL